MRKLFETVGSQSSSRYQEFTTFIANYALGGRIAGGAHPLMQWYNDNTYFVGYTSNEFNNRVIIGKIDNQGVAETNYVGTGTVASEPFDHPAPVLYVAPDGFIYVFQNRYHSDLFRYWKSDVAEDVSSFTFQGEFTDNASYLGIINAVNKDLVFLTRRGGTSTYGQSVVKLNLDTGVNTSLQITPDEFSTLNYRHYNLAPTIHGTQTKRVAGIQIRDETFTKVNKVALWVSSDYETFENISGSFSKDVATNGVITSQEIDDYFVIEGSNANRDLSVSTNLLCQVDNDIFVGIVEWNNDFTEFTYVMRKYTIGLEGIQDSTSIMPINTIPDYIYYNGVDLVISGRNTQNLSPNIALLSLDFKKQIFYGNFTYFETGLFFGLPINLDEVIGKYAWVGRSDTSQDPSTGTIPYVLTDDKFIV
jgi:hypothetical protein